MRGDRVRWGGGGTDPAMSALLVTLGDGCRIAYRLDGPEGAPVLVLSSSLGASAGMWEPQLGALRSRFRVLRYDTRGHGGSDVPPGATSMDRLGRDVLELLDALGIERASFCGLSMGGMIGQWLGVRAPDRIDRIVLANTASYMGPPSGWQQRIESVRRGGMLAIADGVLERWLTPAFRAGSPEAESVLRAMLLATNPEGYTACCAAIRDMDQRPTTHLIRRPTLLITATHDPSTPPACADELARAIPMAKLATLDAAHLSNIEQPEAFSRAVLEFLS